MSKIQEVLGYIEAGIQYESDESSIRVPVKDLKVVLAALQSLQYGPSEAQVTSFKAAWGIADREGRIGDRVRSGLESAQIPEKMILTSVSPNGGDKTHRPRIVLDDFLDPHLFEESPDGEVVDEILKYMESN